VKSGVGLAPLPAPLVELDDELMYLIGPMQELNYPVYLFTQPDLRRVPRISAFFEYSVSKLGPILIGAETRKKI
jgi:DNA-binding transcriptional LysR family regulator